MFTCKECYAGYFKYVCDYKEESMHTKCNFYLVTFYCFMNYFIYYCNILHCCLSKFRSQRLSQLPISAAEMCIEPT